MSTYREPKYVSVSIDVDGQIVDKLLVRRTIEFDTKTNTYRMPYGGRMLSCTHTDGSKQGGDFNIATCLRFRTIDSATIPELLTELGKRIEAISAAMPKEDPVAQLEKIVAKATA